MVSPVKIWRNQKDIKAFVGKEGRIVSYTVITAPPKGFKEQAPYPVVIVALDDDRRFVGQLVDWEREHLRIGQRVAVVVRRIYQTAQDAVIPYGVKFKPIQGA